MSDMLKHGLFGKKIEKTSKALILGRKGYPPDVGKFLSKNKDEIIRHITVCRTPIASVINKIIDVFGGDYDYDRLMHLRLQVTCRSGFKFTIEKNSQIVVTNKFRTDKNDEKMHVKQAFATTIDDFLSNTEKAMGKNYYIYRSASSNCQDFCIGLLKSNGVTDVDVFEFIKQDTDNIFKNHPKFKAVANVTTGLGEKADIVMQGGTIDNKQSKKKLIMLIKAYNKTLNIIRNYSTLNKSELLKMLTTHFDIYDNVLKKKQVEVKVKKRIAPTIVSTPAANNLNSGLTKGQQTYMNKISLIEQKERDKKLRAKFNLIRKF